MTAIQELIRQLKGAIQLIDDYGVLNDYAQCRKEVYESVLDNAVSLAASQHIQGDSEAKPCEHNWVSSVAYKGAKVCSKCSLIK